MTYTSRHSISSWHARGVFLVGFVVVATTAAAVAAVEPDLLGVLSFTAALVSALLVVPLEIAVAIVIVIAPIRIYMVAPVIGVNVSLTTVAIILIGLTVIARSLATGAIRLTRGEWLLVVWWAWMAIGVLWSVDRTVSARGLLQWTLFFVVVVLTTRSVVRAESHERVLRLFITSVVALSAFWCLVGVLQMLSSRESVLAVLRQPIAAMLFSPNLMRDKLVLMNFNWIRDGNVQPFGPFINSISFGIFTAVGIAVTAGAFARRFTSFPRVVVGAMMVLAVMINIATLKGTGWMAAIVGLIVLNVALGGSVKRAVVGLLVSVLLVGVTAFVFRELIVERVLSLVAREGVSAGTLTAISRPSIWLHYVHVAWADRFVGTGLFTAENFGPVQFTTAGAGGTTTVRAPTENGYLAILVEQGIIGLTLFVIVIGGACLRGIRVARRRKDHALATAAGLAAVGASAILVGNMTVNDFANDTSLILLGLFVGIILAAVRHFGPVHTIAQSQ